MPLTDLGVVDVDLIRFAPFSSSLHVGPSSSALKWSGSNGGARKGAVCPTPGLLCLLLFPAVGRSRISDMFLLLEYAQESQGYWAPLRALMILSWLPSNPKYILLKANRRMARAIRHRLPQAASTLSSTQPSICSSVLVQVWWCIYAICSAACHLVASRSLLSLAPNGCRLHSIAHQQPWHTSHPNGGTTGQIGGVDPSRHQHFLSETVLCVEH